MMTDIALRNPRRTLDGTIDCEIQWVDGGPWLPFTAAADDATESGRALHARLARGEFGALAGAPSQSAPVPRIVSMRQARLALLEAGLLDAATAAITAGPAAVIEWEYATVVDRTSPLVIAAAAALGLSDDALLELFATAGGK